MLKATKTQILSFKKLCKLTDIYPQFHLISCQQELLNHFNAEEHGVDIAKMNMNGI